MARNHGDWIKGFLEYTEGLKSPEIFRRWAAVSAVSAALQRRVFVRVGRQRTYPNLYVLLISYPGVGKSNAIKFSRNVVRKVSSLKLAPSRITAAAFYDELQAAKGSMMDLDQNTMYQHHSMTAMIDEFSVFVRPSAQEFMDDLMDLYDCPDPFEYKTKHQGENLIANSWFNLIGGATPSYLQSAWSSAVLDRGFPARCIIVHSDQRMKIDVLDEDDEEAEEMESAERTALARDLSDISSLRGRFTWEKEAGQEFSSWVNDGMKPAPTDARLEHYCERRIVHVAKLCLVTSASRRDDQEITLSDFHKARDTLLEAEEAMPRAIDLVGSNPLRPQMLMAQKFVQAQHAKSKNGVLEHRVRNILINEVDPMRMRSLMEEMVKSHWIIAIGEEPNRRLYPPGWGGGDGDSK
jgi:hypothetical protein